MYSGDSSRRRNFLKRIFNENYHPYFTLPNGMTITVGGSSDVLNEAILESPIVKEACAKGQIRIEDVPEPSENGHA
jgi:hypothetical protein